MLIIAINRCVFVIALGKRKPMPGGANRIRALIAVVCCVVVLANCNGTARGVTLFQ